MRGAIILPPVRSRSGCRSPAKDTPRTGLSISGEMVPSTKPWMALPSGCIAGSRKTRISFALRCDVFAGPLISLPPASFTICPNLSDFHGRNAIPSGEKGVWRSNGISTSFHPVKGRFGRMAALIAEAQAQASRLIELGVALVSKAGPCFIIISQPEIHF